MVDTELKLCFCAALDLFVSRQPSYFRQFHCLWVVHIFRYKALHIYYFSWVFVTTTLKF